MQFRSLVLFLLPLFAQSQNFYVRKGLGLSIKTYDDSNTYVPPPVYGNDTEDVLPVESTEPPSPSPTPMPTNAPTPTPTSTPTSQPTNQPTPCPSPAPTSQPTSQPTPTPTFQPTALPTPAPTASEEEVLPSETSEYSPYTPPPTTNTYSR